MHFLSSSAPLAAEVTSAGHFIHAAMEFALPYLKGLSALIIIWGIACAAFRLVRMEIRLLQGKQFKRDAAEIRLHLGFYLLLALEFLIAVDVIETLLHPDWKELGILAALVVLRTLMSYSLHWELKEIEQKQLEEE
ncbi:MAG: DUF1622 domain-containing protein [Hyphomicrobiaceae bacterium]